VVGLDEGCVGGRRRNVGAGGELDDHSVVRAVVDSELAVGLHRGAVLGESTELLSVLGMPDASVIDQGTLVETLDQGGNIFVKAVGVNAAGGDLGVAGVVLLHDALSVEDAHSVSKGLTQPAELDVGDLIRELTNEDSGQSRLGESRSGRAVLLGVGSESDFAGKSGVDGTFGDAVLSVLNLDAAVNAVRVVAEDAANAGELLGGTVTHTSDPF
jgi:hypothetical protein